MQKVRLWRRQLKTRIMREQHAVCPACSLPLTFSLAVLTRLDLKSDFMPENVQLIHPECQRIDRASVLDAGQLESPQYATA
jgi:hypothetical protein